MVQLKYCNNCKCEKNILEFSKNKSKKDGFSDWCKQCNKEYKSNYYKKNRKKLIEKVSIYYENNKEKIKDRLKEYYSKPEITKHVKEYKSQYTKEYYSKNKDKINEYHKNYIKNKYENNIDFRLRICISKSISHHVKKNTESCLKYLPYTIEELRKHLESQFESWMDWDNYGRVSNNRKTWQIDHIIPQSALPYFSMSDENFKKCWALENLRPLEAIANIKKSNKFSGKI